MSCGILPNTNSNERNLIAKEGIVQEQSILNINIKVSLGTVFSAATLAFLLANTFFVPRRLLYWQVSLLRYTKG